MGAEGGLGIGLGLGLGLAPLLVAHGCRGWPGVGRRVRAAWEPWEGQAEGWRAGEGGRRAAPILAVLELLDACGERLHLALVLHGQLYQDVLALRCPLLRNLCRSVISSCRGKASWLRLGQLALRRPLFRRQIVLSAALSSGQPQPIGRLGRAGTQATRASLSTERCRRTGRRRAAHDAAARSRRGGAAAPTPAMGRAAASCVGPRRLPSLLAVPCLRARARSKSSQVSCHYQFSPIMDMRAI